VSSLIGVNGAGMPGLAIMAASMLARRSPARRTVSAVGSHARRRDR